MRTLYLCGAGNGEGIRLALQVNRASRRWRRIVLLDDDASKHGSTRMDLCVAGSFDLLREADPALDEVVNLVTRTTAGRARARERIAGFRIPFASLVHPGVDLIGTQLAGEVSIYEHATIGAAASVGRSSVVLVGAVVGHGSRLGQGCVVAPNAVINARVVLDDGVYLGSNASILPDLRIGAGATIAANTLVLADVPAGATALGVPATLMQAAGAGTMAAAVKAAPASAPAGRAGSPVDTATLESDIAAAMRELLSLADVPRGGNFFDLGGTSLKAIQLSRRIGERCGIAADALDVFRFPTVAALAAHYGGVSDGSALSQARQRAAMRRWR
ncbi:phosphopantetheine-binding protein [Ramlibacter tataouinensis]|uniref:phosphopantetheine-binding protein n=1 Tax=Ramlibacter tataouinensis TaxID=94132 RepID=UPI0022F3B2E6|nr:phosphopantetheine-binding protein [Ramlibacter tataouinensis]WBY03875.1 phosphopantetheine-binding protein [Ramlibacter tataouinensis]